MATDQPNKGGRPPHPDGPKDDFYGFRGPSSIFGRFRRAAGRNGATVLIQFLSWWLGDEGAELPERPADARRAA
jgi:hypothetical protein